MAGGKWHEVKRVNLSFPRKRESREDCCSLKNWIPASAGMTKNKKALAKRVLIFKFNAAMGTKVGITARRDHALRAHPYKMSVAFCALQQIVSCRTITVNTFKF